MDEKVLQEFRIIETEDGFRIEIKGDKEELRPFVMSLNPQNWPHRGPGPEPGPFEVPWMRGARRWMRGPFGWGPWAAWEDEDALEEEHFHGRGRRGGRGLGGRGRGHGHHEHHEHHEHHTHESHHEDAEDVDEA